MSIEWDIEELACMACGKSEEETEQIINDSEVDDLLYEKYEVSFEQYSEIVKDLLPFTPVVKSALMGESFHAFVNNDSIVVRIEAE